MTIKLTKIALALGLLLFPLACAGDSGSALTGAWRMSSLEVGAEPGSLRPVPYTGEIVFTERGTMSVQAMNPDSAAPPTPYTVNGYEAFYGPVTIDEANGSFVVTVESSLVRGMIGQRLERRFEVSGQRLILTPANPREGFRATYERD